MSAIQITTIAPEAVTRGTDFIECKPFVAKLLAGSCAIRQEQARAGNERLAPCAKCEVGELVTRRLKIVTAPVPKCAREGCERDVDEGEEELCGPHARAVRARGSRLRGEKTMAKDLPNPGLCTAEGCETPRAGLPSRVPGGETLCRRHRQHLRMNQMRAAGLPANGRADLLEAVIATPPPEPCSWEGCEHPRSLKPTDIEGGESLCGRHRGVLAAIEAKKARREAKAVEPPAVKPVPLADAPTVPMETSERDAVTGTLAAEREPIPRIKPRAGALRVYVAAAKKLVVHARAAAEELQLDDRIAVVSRWQRIVEEGAEDPLDYAALKRILSDNLDDLRSCDVVLALTCRDAGRGVYGEIGRALEMGKLVVWSLQRGGRCQDLADERVIEAPTDAQAIQIVRTLAAWRGAA